MFDIHYKNFLGCIAIGYLCNYDEMGQLYILLDEVGLDEMAINRLIDDTFYLELV